MSTHQLTIMFSGICSHFHGVVPGVPHRVVLPLATSVHFGLVRTEERKDAKDAKDTKPVGYGSYYLLPHFPVVLSGSAPGVEPVLAPHLPDMPGVIEHGHIVTGARLQIANAVPQELRYDDPSYEQVPSIRDFVPDYQYSNEVVLGGRAAAYFDIFGGEVGIHVGQGRAISVVVDIETDGLPVLQVTPFGALGSAPKPFFYEIGEGCQLSVLNSDIDADSEDTPYDFLLHYLTSRRGIPQVLSRMLPGLEITDSGHLPRAHDTDVAKALRSLATTITNGRPTKEQLTAMANVSEVLNPSCSDTRYP